MTDLARLEKERDIRPSPEIDAFMKVVILNSPTLSLSLSLSSNYILETNLIAQASAFGGRTHSISTDYVLKVLGLDVCSETIVGNDMLRGVSGGQKRRVTTGFSLTQLIFIHPWSSSI